MNEIQLTNGARTPLNDDDGRNSSSSNKAAPWLWQLRRYFFFLSRKWWILVLTIAAFLALGMAYNRWMPQSYVTSARMWMPGDIRVADSAIYEDRSQFQDIGSTQAELLKSDLIQGRARATLQAAGIIEPSNSAVKLRVTQIVRTSLLEINARGSSSNYVCAFLNATMDELLAYESEIHDQQSQVTFSSLNDQISHKEKELKAQQDKLTAYMQSNNVPVLEQTAKAASAYLTELLTDYSRLSLEYDLLKAACADKALNLNSQAEGLLLDFKTTASGTAAPRADAQKELDKLTLLKASFAKYYRPQHPKMVKLDEEIAQAQGLCDALRLQSREQLAGTMNMVKVKMDSTQESIKEWEAKVNSASQRIADYERVKLDEERMRSFCDHLALLLQNVDVSRNLPRYSVSILDRASPAKPAKLQAKLVLAIALLFGLIAGLGLVRLIEMWSDKVTSLEYLSHHFAERIVGHIPEVPKLEIKAGLSPLVLENARHLYAESFRSVRSTLFFGVNHAKPPRVILVTSAVPREGKSTVAANLASTIAFGGSRVLLIDGDMRRGKLHALYGLPQEPGLADFLTQDKELDSFVRETATKNLFLLPCGRADGHIGEILLRPAFDRLLEHVRRNYDYAIIDSVPVLATDDTSNAAPKTDGVIFVMRDSFTGASEAEQALRALYDRRVQVLGIVFNRVNRSRSFSYCQFPEYYEREPIRMKSGDVAVFDT
jgi:capsular exopolysaccharide synthesis family protein